MTTRKSFVIYTDLLGSLDQLSDAQAGKLFKAIKAYHLSVFENSQDGKAEFDSLMSDFVTRLAFHPFKASFERDAEKYQSIVARNRENGKKGGRRKVNPNNPVGSLGFSGNPKEPKQTQTCVNDNDNVNVKLSPDGDSACACGTQSLFDEEEKKSRKRKSPPRPKPPEPPPPTIEEVKDYFLSRQADERLDDWQHEAEVFYNHFSSLGWKTSAGAKVERWDSRANLWIMEHERRPIIQKNETEQSDKFSGRRGTEPGTKSRKGFKGTF